MEIYRAVLTGRLPKLPVDFRELEARAHAAMPQGLVSYVAGGWLRERAYARHQRVRIRTLVADSADGAGLLQHRDGPAAQRPDRGPPFLHHQHRDRSCAETNPYGPSPVPHC